MTTDAVTLGAAAKLGIKNVAASQWAASSSRLVKPLQSSASACLYDVSFIGMAYGNRRAHVRALAPLGAVDLPDVSRVYRSSRVSLNFADSGLQMSGGTLWRSRQIKARTFEVPGAGGFLLSEENPNLAKYFHIGEELVTYRDHRDLAQKIRYYLDHPDERDAIAWASHERVKREHLYEARFRPIFAQAIGSVSARRKRRWDLSSDLLLKLVDKHRRGSALRRFIDRLRGVCGKFAYQRRFWRALRRLVYEVSWRACGDRTFRAVGLPGRFFYRES